MVQELVGYLPLFPALRKVTAFVYYQVISCYLIILLEDN